MVIIFHLTNYILMLYLPKLIYIILLMRNYIILLVALSFLFSCSNNTYTINGETDHESNLDVFLVKIGNSNLPVMVDSTIVSQGKFSFTDTISIPEMHYIVFDKQRENLPVILEPGTINLKIYKDSIRASKISGTKSNKDFTTYKSKTKDFYSELTEIQNEIRTANFIKDTVLIRDLTTQFESLRTKLLQYEESFIVDNNDSYLSSLILQRMLMNQELEFETIESYFSRFTEIIKKTKSSKEIKNRINEVIESKNAISIGSVAPDFEGPGLNEEYISLSNVKSKIILLDFWASWCGPCRIENPDLVKLKNKYSSDEFQIIGISLDRDRDSWVSAIKNDKIENWVHISNLKFWGEPIAKLYKVIQMPTSFLLDENRNIIGKDVKGVDLDNLISKQLNK